MVSAETKRRAIFFDRDGVINDTTVDKIPKSYAPRNPNELEVFPEVPQIINLLKKEGYIIIVVSNQPDIALNKINEETRKALEEKFLELITQQHIPIDRIYYCHHHPSSVNPDYSNYCDCRKPKPGMFLQAEREFGLDLSSSWLIGDGDKDINAGQAAGCTTILLKRAWSGVDNCNPDHIVNDLKEILDIITLKHTMSLSR